MMPVAGLLLLTGLLAQAQTSSLSAPAPATDAVAARAAVTPQSSSQPGEGVPAPSSEPVHQVGVGASMALGGRGGGGGFRYFFSDRVGFNANVSYYRPMVSGPSQGGTLLVAPSIVYMLTPSNKNAAVGVRPYVGGGLNYAYGSTPIQTGTVVRSASSGGLGMQAFGGVELTFRDANGLAISAEVTHYQMAVSPVSTGLGQGTTNFYLLFHYYMR
jgi:hypothetical protein